MANEYLPYRYEADLDRLTASKYGTGEEAEISTRTDKAGYEYKHIATGGDKVITTITGENVPVGKIMFLKYRLNNGHYPEGDLAVRVRYTVKVGSEGTAELVEKLAVGVRAEGAVPSEELIKRHRAWVIGRVNAQSALKNEGLWTTDGDLVDVEAITITIEHSDDLDIAYFMTSNFGVDLQWEVYSREPVRDGSRNVYYMHQEIEFGRYLANQWRKINSDETLTNLQDVDFTYDNGFFAAPYPPDYPDDPDPVYRKVSFDLCGFGSEIKAQTVLHGKKATKPMTPSAGNYRFVAWYTDPEYKTEYNFDNPVTSDLTLYAKWSETGTAQKLRQIAENVQRVFDAGVKAGHEDGYNEGHEDGYNEGHSEGYAEGHTAGYKNGRMDSEYGEGYNDGFADGEASVDNYLPLATKVFFDNYNVFGKKEVVLNVPLVADFNSAFKQNILNTTVEHLTVKGSLDGKITQASMAFYSGYHETALKRLTLNCDFSKCTTFSYMMTYLAALEVIDGIPIDFSSATAINDWHGCALGSSLRELRVAPNTIKANISFSTDKLLSYETIQSIIGGLENTVSGKTLTLHKTAVNNAFTDEEWATLIATKPNWTISLA